MSTVSDERRGRRAGPGREILRGDLSGFGLIALLQIAEIERINGWIHVSGGSIALAAGTVVGASFGAFSGVDALRELLFGAAGRFSVVRGEVSACEAIADITSEAMESCRRRDEWSRLSGKTLRRSERGRALAGEGPLGAVLGELDGVRSLAEALQRARATPTQVIDGVVAALARGDLAEVRNVVRQTIIDDDDEAPIGATPPRAPEPAVDAAVDAAREAEAKVAAAVAAAVADDPDFDALMARSRDARRVGEFDVAEALIRRALALAPGDRVALQNLKRIQELRDDRGRGGDDVK